MKSPFLSGGRFTADIVGTRLAHSSIENAGTETSKTAKVVWAVLALAAIVLVFSMPMILG